MFWYIRIPQTERRARSQFCDNQILLTNELSGVAFCRLFAGTRVVRKFHKKRMQGAANFYRKMLSLWEPSIRTYITPQGNLGRNTQLNVHPYITILTTFLPLPVHIFHEITVVIKIDQL